MPGCLVVFEGTEGSGKSSQIRRARAWLEPHVDLVVTREPGGTPTAETIRSVVLTTSGQDRDPSTDAFLLNAARHDHCRRVIAPAVARGAVVLSDRFSASTLAYQGAGDGVPLAWLTKLQTLATGGLTPNRCLLLDLDVEIGLARRHGAGELNAIDCRDVAFHRRVREGYHGLVAKDPAAWTVIAAAADEEAVWGQVKAAIIAVMEERGLEPPS